MTHPDGGVTVSFKVAFGRGPRGQKRAVAAPPVRPPTTPPMKLAAPQALDRSNVAKITRMLVLGYHFERLVREGKVKNYAQIARLARLSRARVTQIVDLTFLSPEIQDAILLTGEPNISPPMRMGARLRSLVPPGERPCIGPAPPSRSMPTCGG